MSIEAIKVIADILATEMVLPSGHVMLAYERFTILANNGIYVALNYVGGHAIGNNNYFDSVAMIETQEVAMLYQIQIDMMSFGPDARERKEEVYQALRSIYAQQAMEANHMQIARIPMDFINASSLEETKILNRFTMTIEVTALLTKEKAVTSYYGQFPFQFDENNSGTSPIYNPEETFNG